MSFTFIPPWPPHFPPPTWNQFEATLSGCRRTNNTVESYNYQVTRLIGKKNPTFFDTLDALPKEAEVVESNYRRLCQNLLSSIKKSSTLVEKDKKK